jgi:hypothetical protein
MILMIVILWSKESRGIAGQRIAEAKGSYQSSNSHTRSHGWDGASAYVACQPSAGCEESEEESLG